MAHLLIHTLREGLAPGCLPLFTSDGLNLYFYALTAHFGHWRQVCRRGREVLRWQVAAGLIYGQVKKSYRRRKLVRVTPLMRLGTQEALKAALQGLSFSGRVNTAIIPRVNLTIRHAIAALARRTWATAQQSPQLQAHLEWWRAYYHGCRVRMPRCGWHLRSHMSEVPTWWPNATDNGPLPWQPAEPIDDGRHARCSCAPCHRFPLEWPQSLWELYHGVGNWVKVLAENPEGASRWEEQATLDCLNIKSPPEVGLARAGRFIHQI